ncbi:MAG: ABC transporter permease [Chloroflexi bacterium]|nr:ABC transporter permease [Chloroflexota bacterium]
MRQYILRRLILAIPTFFGAVTLVFLVMRVLPGDVVAAVLGTQMEQESSHVMIEQLREKLGLKDPIYVQYGRWLWGAVRFDFGKSIYTGEVITSELKRRYPITINLMVMSLVIAFAVGIPFGIISALKQDTWIDYALRIMTIGGLSIPNFFIGILIILALVIWFRWLPPIDYAPFWKDPLLNLKQLILPALVTGFRLSALGTRMTRSSMLEVMREDYIRTARAKGLRDAVVVYRHALKNAFLPVITLVGLEIIALFGGIVIMETLFRIPGVGRLLLDSIFNRDYNVVQALVFIIAGVVVLVNILIDLLYAWIDPRIKYA